MDKQTKLMSIFGGLLVVIFALTAFAVCSTNREGPGPADAFVAHLRALDEGRIADANALVDITCGQVRESDVAVAQADLASAGLTFESAFRVREVWTNQDGTRALLSLDVPQQLALPTGQGMALIDGDWLLYCGRD